MRPNPNDVLESYRDLFCRTRAPSYGVLLSHSYLDLFMVKRSSVLPSSLPPRGLSRVQAAEYIGVSPTKFDEMVEDRAMPKPKRVGSRTIWDRIKLDEAFEALPGDEDVNPWDAILKK